MITKFAIENFKSIGKPGVSLELKPLTILVGPNGSGKSNILEALALLAQNVGRQGFDYSGGDYSSMEDIAHKRILDYWATMEIHADLEAEESRKLSDMAKAVNEAGLGLAIDKVDSIGYRYSSRLKDVTETRQSILSGEKELITAGYIKITETNWRNAFEYPPLLLPASPRGEPYILLTPRVFTQSGKVVEEAQPLTNFAQAAVEVIASELRVEGGRKTNIFLISSLRGEVKYEVETSKWAEWVGKRGENLLSILAQVSNPEYESKRERIKKWALEFDLRDPWGGWTGSNKAGGSFVDPELGVSFNLALASQGSRQVLSIITQLFWSGPGNVIMIEEPEISLHPKAKIQLPYLFSEVIKEKKQIIITTHDEFLPLALGKAVRENKLQKEDVAIYELVKGKNGTKGKKLNLDEKGRIIGWIPEFRKVEDELYEEWSNSLPEE